MKIIKVSDLRPGLRFDKPVYVDAENLLVPENVEIRQRDIDRLIKWQVKAVQTDGKPLKELPSAKKNSFLQQAFSTPQQQAVIDAYSKIAAEMQEYFERVKSNTPVKAVEIDETMDRLLKLLARSKGEVVQLVLYGLQGESGFIENALNSAVLATLVGQSLNMVQHKLIQLATAALLHDVGMLRVPAAVRNKKTELSPDELKAIQAHPIYSYRIITKEMRFAEEIGVAALQHQERWDGAGYPKGLSGANISTMARVVAVVTAFEAMVSKRPYRDSMIGYAAIKTIIKDNGKQFDPDILRAFIQTMGLFPIGSVVLLKDGRIGRVIEVNSGAPVRPQVKIMIDANGREFQRDEGAVVDLATESDVFIAKAVNPRDIGSN